MAGFKRSAKTMTSGNVQKKAKEQTVLDEVLEQEETQLTKEESSMPMQINSFPSKNDDPDFEMISEQPKTKFK